VTLNTPFHRLGVVQFDNAGGNRKQFGKLRGTKSPCTRDDLETIGVRTDA
jgi:hypothetical protein